MSDAIKDVAAVIAAVGALRLPAGALTEAEATALDVAGAVLAMAKTFGSGHDATADAVLGLLTQVPRVAELALRFVATLRTIEIRAESLTVEIGPLGAGVKVEATPDG